jgi:hypothetical protein
LALPFRRLAAGIVQPGGWHRDLGLPERARQRANPAAMPMARNNCCRILSFRMPGSPAIARARQCRVKLAANHLFDQSAKRPRIMSLIGSNQSLKKVGVGLDCRMRKFRRAAVHIFDYKPDARANKPIALLTIYALALSRLTGLKRFHIKCAWFNRNEYHEFLPRILLSRIHSARAG